MTFCYDLGEELCSFDFYGWLVQAQAAGATEITFDTRRLPPGRRARFDSIVKPGPALAGLPSREGPDGVKLTLGSSRLGSLVRFARSRDGFRRLKATRFPGMARYTVTLRQQAQGTYRNSNAEAWRAFAGEIGALVIEDYDVQPIDLHERMALYAGAELNLGIFCGPTSLCTLTEYPTLVFAAGRGKQRIIIEKYGVPYGENMPWCLPNQRVLWDDDNLPTIRRVFNEWRETWRSAREQPKARASA